MPPEIAPPELLELALPELHEWLMYLYGLTSLPGLY
jgi:hypothetical protein